MKAKSSSLQQNGSLIIAASSSSRIPGVNLTIWHFTTLKAENGIGFSRLMPMWIVATVSKDGKTLIIITNEGGQSTLHGINLETGDKLDLPQITRWCCGQCIAYT